MVKVEKDTELITIKEAAEIYGCSPTRIHQFVKEGRLTPLMSEGRVTIFDKADVEQFRLENLEPRRKYLAGVIKAARKVGDIDDIDHRKTAQRAA